MKSSQNWQNAVPVDKLQKHQLKVKMCCAKCEEKVVEEIREVHGVFDVRGERFNSKVVVVSMPPPNNLNEHEVLRRARKVDKKARFVDLDAKEKPKTEEQKKKEAEEAKKKKEEEEKKKKEAEEKKKREEALKKEHEAALANVITWRPPMVPPQWGGPYYPPAPLPQGYYPGEYFFREFTARQKEEEEKKKKEAEEKKKKEEEEKKKAKEAEEMKKKEQEAAASIAGYMWNPNGLPWGGPYYPPQPYPYYPEDLQEPRPSQWYAPRYQYPPLPFQKERDEYSRPYFYY
ncbi:hypothetical protein M758_8G111200 [Ceratodon purpureus]|nr:hypothetical protein KC19_8G114900 [Ceratodon purpureus]KAG0608518.1 hypothetical protein M758_8G111200 [Ceratodon purpureus]